MKRNTPLKRTAFRREGPSTARREHPRAEASTLARKACAHCGSQFTPARPMQNVCGPVCARRKVEAAKKAEKASDRARKEALKTLSQLEEECRRIVQKIARIRDRHDGCISCHVGPNYGGVWHGSHYRPAGMNAAVQFHLWNIHKACEQCNFFKGGNIAAYRPRLVAKIGEDRVKWLESQNQTVKNTRAYLARFKAVMGKRLRRVEKRARKEVGNV